MSHKFSSLSDAEIDAISAKRDKRYRSGFVLLGALIVVGIAIAFVAPAGNISGIAGLVASGAFLAAFLLAMHCTSSVDELERLDLNESAMDQALELFGRSPAAKRERDRILASGRSLRVFDLWDFERVHNNDVHQQKVQQLTGQ